MSRRVDILSNTDWLTVVLYILLVAFGWMNIYAVNLPATEGFDFNVNNRYSMQIIWIIISLLFAAFLFLIDSRLYVLVSYGFYAFCIVLLLIVLFAGYEVHNSKSWINLGFISVQPSEFAKLGSIFILAKYFSGHNLKNKKFKHYMLGLAMALFPALLIALQPDIGSTMVYVVFLLVLFREGMPGWILILLLVSITIFILSLILADYIILMSMVYITLIAYLLFTKNVKFFFLFTFIYAVFNIAGIVANKQEWLPFTKYLIVFGGMLIATVIVIAISLTKKLPRVLTFLGLLFVFIAYTYTIDFAFNNIMQEHQQKRIKIMLGLESDPFGYEYNIRQSKIAIGSGGISGKGFLKGTQTKYRFVPEQSTDFIFCTVGEEWGFLGSFALVATFVFLLLRLILLAERQRSTYSRIFGYGVFGVFLFHFGVNIAMTIGLFPVIGIPLPFLSYGGSSLMSFTAMLFIFLKLDASRKMYLI